MVNFKFVKAQFKTIWVILLVFSIVFAFSAMIPILVSNSMGAEFTDGGFTSAAGLIFNSLTFSFFLFCMFWSFGIAMVSNLLNKDISKGYIASWLTTPMSRSTIFNSKLFVLISSVVGINLMMMFLEIIIGSWKMVDFKETIGHLLLTNLSWMCLFLLTVSIIWIVFCIFARNGVAVGISFAIFGWFALCWLMTTVFLYFPGWEWVKNFKYLTIWSLFNSSLEFEVIDGNAIPYGVAKILPIKALDFAWQIPVMVIGAIGIYTGGQFIVKSKDFAF